MINLTIKNMRSLLSRWILLASIVGCMSNVTAQNVLSHTQVVPSSTESIESPFPRYENLPKTISFDYLTDSEIQKIRQDFFLALSTPDYGKTLYGNNIGPTNCMQWILMRTSKEASWQAVGVMQSGRGMMKINGAFRTIAMSYTRQIERGAFGKYRPRSVPGSGAGWVTSFLTLNSYADYVKNRTAIERSQFDHFENIKDKKTSACSLRFGSTKTLRIDQSRGPCSYVHAACRRYAWDFDRLEWHIPPYGNEQFAEVSFDSALHKEMAIEDMCPFAYEAAVEGPINTRMGGAEPGIKKYGLPKNTPLLEALRPYMSAGAGKGAK